MFIIPNFDDSVLFKLIDTFGQPTQVEFRIVSNKIEKALSALDSKVKCSTVGTSINNPDILWLKQTITNKATNKDWSKRINQELVWELEKITWYYWGKDESECDQLLFHIEATPSKIYFGIKIGATSTQVEKAVNFCRKYGNFSMEMQTY